MKEKNKKAHKEFKKKNRELKSKTILAFLLALITYILIFFTDETISLLLLISNKIEQLKELL